MNIGEELRLRRRKNGLTQESIAEKMSITRQTLSNWEVGKNLPDIYSIVRLAQIYHISLDELLLGKIYFKGVQRMKTNFNDGQIENMIKTHFLNASCIRPLNGGLVSQTLSFIDNGKQYVFQIGNLKEAYEKEKLVSGLYKNGLPVRNIKEINSLENGTAYYLLLSDYH